MQPESPVGLPADALARMDAEVLSAAFRNIPNNGRLTVGRIGEAGWQVTDLLLPTLTLRASALDQNVALFSRWCRDNGVDHAPHGKTTMSPQLFDRQLAAGAWAITAATVGQARLMRGFGVRRILLANQVIDPVGLRWIAEQSSDDGDVEIFVLVDSVDGVEQMAEALRAATPARPVPVLVELGAAGGRAGVRTVAAGLEVAERVGRVPELMLAGVECFEGIYPQDGRTTSVTAVDRLLATVSELVGRIDEGGYFGNDEIVVTAGGSAYPDRATNAWTALPGLSRPARRVVRSGGYLTHDHAMLERCSPLSEAANHPLGALRPALHLWAHVLSVPEPGLAICGLGKRDAPFDVDLPIPLGRTDRAGAVSPLPGARVERLNDQHAFVRHDGELGVGDVVQFGISHPCTAFDKWPLIPVLDDANRVVSAVRTYF